MGFLHFRQSLKGRQMFDAVAWKRHRRVGLSTAFQERKFKERRFGEGNYRCIWNDVSFYVLEYLSSN